ncbi:MAG: hypothetical protein CL797_01685 [Chromatiales bacterium]|nr:hypothetical protein [Chromatiales bacterium]
MTIFRSRGDAQIIVTRPVWMGHNGQESLCQRGLVRSTDFQVVTGVSLGLFTVKSLHGSEIAGIKQTLRPGTSMSRIKWQLLSEEQKWELAQQ